MCLSPLLEYVEAQKMIGKTDGGTLVENLHPIGKWALLWLAVQCDRRIYKGHEHEERYITPDTITHCE